MVLQLWAGKSCSYKQTGQRSVWGNSQWPGQYRTEEAPTHSLPWQHFSPLLTLPWVLTPTETRGTELLSLYRRCWVFQQEHSKWVISNLWSSQKHKPWAEPIQGMGIWNEMCLQLENHKTSEQQVFGTLRFKSFTGKFNLIIKIIYLCFCEQVIPLLWFFPVTQHNSVSFYSHYFLKEWLCHQKSNCTFPSLSYFTIQTVTKKKEETFQHKEVLMYY